jgi:hypothetical protein
MPNLAPSDSIEFHHVRRPTSATAATRNQSTRIDVGKYEYLIIAISAGSLGGTTTLTPVMYPTATGGTGVRCDGTNGQADLRIDYSGTDDNLGSCVEMRCAGLPGQFLAFEEVLSGTNTYTLIVLGVLRASTAQAAANYDLPLGSAEVSGRKIAHYGFA